ncbi:MAG: YlmH/Sll1252 family protein [Lachnospiraceae bacterium]|nr:YlmH/Sll1252 family protein [Ruminococcus sp.]MCM1274697.1 YlmH/Sll1252 family protein [Lachnospiraceae bacterium]
MAGYGAAQAGAVPMFYGGYDGAARTVCGFLKGTYAEEMSADELFPVRAVTFSFRSSDKLSHRDFLGAVLSTGLQRSVVGDILVAGEYAVVFCLDTAEELVSGITKIGKVGVRAEKGIAGELPRAEFERIDAAVSSLRLDCIVSACTNISREKSASLVKSGQVSADFSVCLNVSAAVKEKTVVSIRGFGRFRLAEVVGQTKKGRLRVVIEKYV